MPLHSFGSSYHGSAPCIPSDHQITGAHPASTKTIRCTRVSLMVPSITVQTYGLNLGLAMVGADLKGAPAPLPCRIKVVTEKDVDATSKVCMGSHHSVGLLFWHILA